MALRPCIRLDCHTMRNCRKAAQAAPGERRASAPGTAAVWAACALLVLPTAHAHASVGATTRSWHRHGRNAEPGAGPPRGNQTTAAPPQEQDRPAAGTLQDCAHAWLANPTLALAAHGPIAAWDTSGETDLGRIFRDAATFNEDLNT